MMIAATMLPTTWYPPFTAPQVIALGFCDSNCAVTSAIGIAKPDATMIPSAMPSANESVFPLRLVKDVPRRFHLEITGLNPKHSRIGIPYGVAGLIGNCHDGFCGEEIPKH
jgi:hypothetical protein